MKPHARRNLLLLLAGWSGAVAALAADPPRFASVQALTNRELQWNLTATKGSNYLIETSADLKRWDPFLALRSTGTDPHVDSAAPWLEARYYRASEAADTIVLTGDLLTTDDGELVIHPINHASVVVRWKNRMLYIDPVGATSLYQGIPRADLILITHQHSDHLSTSTIDSVKQASTVILTSQTVYGSLSAGQRGQATWLANGGSTNLGDLTVEAVPAYNLTASNHPKGVGNGYVVTLGGKRVYFSGDTEDTPELRALKGIDVAFLGVNTPFTMPVAKAASAIREFRPKIVYPYHYRNSDGTYSDLNALKRQVGTDTGTEVRIRKWY